MATSPEQLKMDVILTQNELRGLSDDVDGLGKRVSALDVEMRRGFNNVTVEFQKLGTDVAAKIAGIANEFRGEVTRISAPKGIQWPMISVVVVVALALAGWANNFFGKDINSLSKETQGLTQRLNTVSDRAFEQAVEAARASGAADENRKQIQKDLDRVRAELDHVAVKREAAAP